MTENAAPNEPQAEPGPIPEAEPQRWRRYRIPKQGEEVNPEHMPLYESEEESRRRGGILMPPGGFKETTWNKMPREHPCNHHVDDMIEAIFDGPSQIPSHFRAFRVCYRENKKREKERELQRKQQESESQKTE
mmetsp:Transcript_19343/g.33332  ORF Transcript_19343/g.33332 Transcript_19343/m.33332 type:complete len:133 (-) Transcript_19343:676-1074(-)